MSNPEMEKPTPAQLETTQQIEQQMVALIESLNKQLKIIGDLRRGLNDSTLLLGSLKEVIGPRAFAFYDQMSWQERIERHLKMLDNLLK